MFKYLKKALRLYIYKRRTKKTYFHKTKLNIKYIGI